MRNLLIHLFFFWAVLFSPLHAAQGADDFLPPEQAFAFSARMTDPATAEVRYRVADGYYLYRDKFAFAAEGAELGATDLPRGKVKFDPNFEKDVETMRGEVVIRIPVQAGGAFTLRVTSQGCSDKGLCYPPQVSEARISPGSAGASSLVERLTAPSTSTPTASDAAASATINASPAGAQGEMGRIEASLASGQLILILPLFMLLGLGLSFTPCVLPMVPILSFIIAGEGTHTNRRRAFGLSVCYSLGMAVVYTSLGIAAGLVGEGLSAALQSPWILGSFALLMTLMALSMFDVYQLQMPASVQLALTRLSERQSGGKFAGVFVMGALSALIVGPCVAAPLAGALVYISQTRDVLIGGSALFAMAIGMSVPLLLVGLSAGALLPRAGAWMQSVKVFFGVLMLALALWMVASLVPAWLLMVGWGGLAAGYGVFLLRVKSLGSRARAIGLGFLLLGLVQLMGVASGGRDPWSPLAHWFGAVHTKTAFTRINSSAELDAALANAGGRRVMLDFYADWCVSCIEMEKFTFVDPKVKPELDQMLLLQADVTANNAEHKALLKRFGLFGPPGIIFFGPDGREIAGARVIGFQSAETFHRSLQRTK